MKHSILVLFASFFCTLGIITVEARHGDSGRDVDFLLQRIFHRSSTLHKTDSSEKFEQLLPAEDSEDATVTEITPPAPQQDLPPVKIPKPLPTPKTQNKNRRLSSPGDFGSAPKGNIWQYHSISSPTKK